MSRKSGLNNKSTRLGRGVFIGLAIVCTATVVVKSRRNKLAIAPAQKYLLAPVIAKSTASAMVWQSLFIVILLISFASLYLQLSGSSSASRPLASPPKASKITLDATQLPIIKTRTAKVVAAAKAQGDNSLNENELWLKIDRIQTSLAAGNIRLAKVEQLSLERQLNKFENSDKHTDRKVEAASAPAILAAPQAKTMAIPIIMYHKVPADFEHQLNLINQKGYTTIWMSQISDYFLLGRPLSPRPVALTFDDGFADQLGSLAPLKQRNFRATYYIISGGERSKFELGAEAKAEVRTDDYLSWDQIKAISTSGVAEIGAHTVDHFQLNQLSSDDQAYEINQNIASLENKLNTKITTLAYPYGEFDQSSIDIARQAGILSAVTTKPGIDQSASELLTLKRIRSAYQLP